MWGENVNELAEKIANPALSVPARRSAAILYSSQYASIESQPEGEAVSAVRTYAKHLGGLLDVVEDKTVPGDLRAMVLEFPVASPFEKFSATAAPAATPDLDFTLPDGAPDLNLADIFGNAAEAVRTALPQHINFHVIAERILRIATETDNEEVRSKGLLFLEKFVHNANHVFGENLAPDQFVETIDITAPAPQAGTHRHLTVVK